MVFVEEILSLGGDVKHIAGKVRVHLVSIFHAYGGLGRGGLFCAYRWFVFPHQRISDEVPRQGLIYDVGSGYGIFSLYLALAEQNRKIIGIDYSSLRLKSSLRAVRNLQLNNLSFKKQDFFDIQWQPCSCVIINDVLHHIPGRHLQEKLLKRIIPAIKKGGKLIIVDVDRKPRWKYYIGLVVDLFFYPGDCIAYPRRAILEEFLKKNGFKVNIILMHIGRPYASIMYSATKQI